MATSSGPEVASQAGGGGQTAVVSQSTSAPKPNSMPGSRRGGQTNNFPAGVDRSPPSTGSAAATTNSSGFGVLAPPPERELMMEAENGFHRDGRVRDPIPSKLKGKTDGRKGNFSVMHMDVAGRSEATQRDAQAKRTSESTELAAKKAFENGYVPLRRTRFLHVPEETAPKQSGPTPEPPPPPPPPPSSRPGRTHALDPVETKAEQARLLTLLRSLHPVLVVDQICKALAFFGGIPGAPPPADDGSFPQSAEANGSGRLFVGWIAEIFPRLGEDGQRRLTPVRELVDVPESAKRKRGRPKGSKATKARKDKGIKKGPLKSRQTTTAQFLPVADMTNEDSWVDVEDGQDEPGLQSQDATLFEQPLSQMETPRLAPPSRPGGQTSTPVPATTASLPSQAPGTAADATPSGKRRGRPKGSKNRPKAATSEVSNTTHAPQPSGTSQIPQIPRVHETSQLVPVTQATPASLATLGNNQSFTAVNSGSNPTSNPAPETPAKKKAGRPKGSKNKPKTGDSPAVTTSASQTLVNGNQPAANASSQDILVPSSQPRRIQSYQESAAVSLPVVGAVPDQASNQTAVPKKRKRKAAKSVEQAQPSNDSSTNATMPQSRSVMLSQSSVAGQNGPPPAVPEATIAIAPPPAKRARKGKEPKSTASTATSEASRTAAVPLPVELPPPTQQQPANNGTLSVSVDHTIASLQSPEDNHFEVQSPTMENYEAQLQAQLEQNAETERPAVSPPNPVNPRQLMASRLQQHQKQQYHQMKQQQQQQQQQHQQQQQQQKQKQQLQRQRSQQQSQQSQLSKTAAGQNRSPRPQQQSAKPQTSTSMTTQQSVRTSQNSFSQYRQANSQYSQSQQSYSPQQRQQFSAQQHSPQISAPASSQDQQYATTTQQQQQFSTGQHQQFAGGQTQYTGGQQQQQMSPQQQQQRFQQLGTTSAATATFAAHQSPQFASSASSSFASSNDGTYRGSTGGGGLNSPAFGAAQRAQQSATTATANGFRAGSTTHGMSPPFGTATQQQQHQHQHQHQQQQQRASSGAAAATHAGVQAGQGVQNLQQFAGNTDWIFDPSNLDASGGHGALNLNGAYSMGAGNVPRASSNSGAAFTQSAMTSFDPSGLGGNDRFYGVGRR